MNTTQPAPTRRDILNTLMRFGFLATLLGFLAPVMAYLMPLRGRGLSGNTLECRDGTPISVDDLREGSGVVGRLAGQPVLVIRKNGQVLGFPAICTHLGCIVRWNDKIDRIECPCHGGKFNLQGEVMGGPAPGPLRPLPLRTEGNRILRG